MSLFHGMTSVSKIQRIENGELIKRLNVRETKDKKGVYCSPSKAIQEIVRLYGEEKLTSLMLKVSVDGKVYGREKQPMVAVGITPLDIGEKVSQQSCYSVFPLIRLCWRIFCQSCGMR